MAQIGLTRFLKRDNEWMKAGSHHHRFDNEVIEIIDGKMPTLDVVCKQDYFQLLSVVIEVRFRGMRSVYGKLQ